MFFKGFKEAQGDETKVKSFNGNPQVSSLAEVGLKVGKSTKMWCPRSVRIGCEVRVTLSRNEQVVAQRPGWNLAADSS